MNPRNLVACSFLLIVLAVPNTGTRSARAASASGPIVPARLVFYRGLDCKKAGKHGKPTTRFGTHTDFINAAVKYQAWQGFHRVTFRFYLPSGKLNKTYTDAFRAQGPMRLCLDRDSGTRSLKEAGQVDCQDVD